MEWTTAKAASLILKHHGVPACLVGELVLNYYNVPRICHDLQICVPKSSSAVAVELLCSTGLFDALDPSWEDEANNYTQYKRGFPHLRTTGWIQPTQTLIIFPATAFGLDPIEKVLVRPPANTADTHISKELDGLSPNDMLDMPLPRLAPLMSGLAKRYLETRDDVSMIALEQLVDGMNPDERWVRENLAGCDRSITALVVELVENKKARIDYFSDNKITCFIRDEAEAAEVRRIPGFG